MKKIIALCLCFVMLFSLTGTFVYADKLITKTIKVNLAEETVTLNDEPLDVAKAPYINENGDTMIDLEALIKAFGANIAKFDEGDGFYAISYGGVSMLYGVGSAEVRIGEQSINMPSPVVKGEDGVVMAPLRFVSEALGADVTYNGETEEVTIIFSGELDEGANLKLLFMYSGKTKIGNSEEHWRFVKTDDFDMAESYYDGNYDFALGDIMVSLVVRDKSEVSSLDYCYIAMQDVSSYDKMVMYDKGKSTYNGVPYAYAKFRKLDMINERYAYESDEFFYLIDIERTFESFAAAKENVDVKTFLESLEFDYTGGEEDVTVDLAKIDFIDDDAQEEKTEYVDGNYRWSVKLNGTWGVNEYYGFYNKVTIQKPSSVENKTEYSGLYYGENVGEKPTITISTYSVPEGETIEQWANEKQALHKNTNNSDVYSISSVKDAIVGKYQAKHFEVRSEDESSVEKLYYLEDGLYRYEISLSYNQEEEEQEDFLSGAEAVIQSFTTGAIDANEVGEALESDSEMKMMDVLTAFEGEEYSASYPCLWAATEADGTLCISKNTNYTGDVIDLLAMLAPEMSFIYGIVDDVSVNVEKKSLLYYDDNMDTQRYSAEAYMKKSVAGLLNLSSSMMNVSMSEEIKEVTLMDTKGYSVELVVEIEGVKVYCTTYCLPYEQDQVIIITKSCGERHKNTIYEKALDNVIDSLKLL